MNKFQEYIGLTDCNKKPIKEGDILIATEHPYDKRDCLSEKIIAVVKYSPPKFQAIEINGDSDILSYWWKPKIIGNVHDDPNLIKQIKAGRL